MRIYIIGNDGITLCREPPAAVNEGEIVVASNEELHAARLSGERLLALWNALPDVEKRKKIGDRDALVDELWSAIETLPELRIGGRAPRSERARLLQTVFAPKVGFAADSLLEGGGFELSVPQRTPGVLAGVG
ncbi:MAG TPA: hypothetical protein VGN30_17100 [Steroidobacteraceae bacterium]|jgi:hypothetical protein